MNSRIKSIVIAVGAIALTDMGGPRGLGAEAIEFHSAETKVSLVELFTSEGCSSCPPAERWLSGLKSNARLWKDYVVVSFHVDYWDELGWKDPFAQRAFADRQRSYATLWKTESVYTPGFVVSGKEWRGWFNREALPQPENKKVGMLSAISNKTGEWELQYEAHGLGAEEKLRFSAALLGFGLSSKVGAGENSGRTLEHDFVVLKFTTIPGVHSDQFFRGSISLPNDTRSNSVRLGVAFWVTQGGDFQPLQAVGGWISK